MTDTALTDLPDAPLAMPKQVLEQPLRLRLARVMAMFRPVERAGS